MKYYKKIKLKCEDQIRDYLIDLVLVPTEIKDQVKIPHNLPKDLLNTINSELASYGVPKILYCQSYLRGKNTTQGIHIDGISYKWHAGINIPIRNTKNTKFAWYGGNYTTELKTQDTGAISGVAPITFFEIITDEPLEEVASIELDQAYLVRVDEPHNASNTTDETRWIFTMRFEGNPTFEELYEKLPE